VLPGEPVAEVQQRLVEIIGNDKITVTQVGTPTLSPPSPLRPDLLRVIEKLTSEFWPGAAIVPSMSAGMTDARFLRNAGIAVYGHSGLAGEPNENRAHGIDERLAVKSFYDGLEYLYKLVKTLAAGE
jgi:acetylornithine deacetylase/succinyl-diaminopimelate desuccinylase-like protein